jgi:hypothetical protein
VQVKNAEPRFMAREGKKTLPFCCKLMAKAEGFTSTFDFQFMSPLPAHWVSVGVCLSPSPACD